MLWLQTLHDHLHRADPVSLGLTILEALQVADIFVVGSITLSQIVGYTLVVAATLGLSILANSLLRPRQPDPGVPSADNGHQAQRQAIMPRQSGYGHNVRIAGAYVFYEEFKGNSYDVYAVHSGRIGAINGYYLHEDAVVVGNDSYVVGAAGTTDIPGAPPGSLTGDGRYTGHNIKIETRLGATPETAYGDIVASFSPLWTNSHRGDGCASAALICSGVGAGAYQQIYPLNKPELSLVCDLAPIFDWRDLAQAQGNPATWKVSDNTVLQLADYMTNVDRGGMGLSYARVVAPALAALTVEANLCDVQVARADTSMEARYAASGFYNHDTEPASVISMMLAACDGWMTQNGDGSLAVWVGVYRAPRVTLTNADILGFTVDYGIPDERLVNELDWSWTNAKNDYKDSPGDPWRDDVSIAALGKTRSQRVQLAWVTSHSRGRRLMKRRMAQLNPRLKGTLITKASGLQALGERWIEINDTRLADLQNLVVEVQKVRMDLKTMRVSFDWIAVNPNEIDAWDPASEEGTEPPIPDKVDGSPFTAPTGISVVAQGDAASNVVLVISFDDPGRSDLTYAVRLRLADDGTGHPGAWTTQNVAFPGAVAGRVTISTSVVQSNKTYQVELAAVGPRLVQTDWSAPINVSTASSDMAPGIPLNFSAVSDGDFIHVDLAWTAPNSANMHDAKVYRNSGSSFGAATLIATIAGTANQAMTYQDAPGGGAWNYWVTAENAGGFASAPAGPQTASP